VSGGDLFSVTAQSCHGAISAIVSRQLLQSS
jgi:hypothetical protein